MRARVTSAIGMLALVGLAVLAFAGLSLSRDPNATSLMNKLSSGNVAYSPIGTPSSSPVPGPSPFWSPLETPPVPATPGPGPEKTVPELMLEYTRQRFPIRSGTPQVILTRTITFSEYREYGLGNFNPGGSEPPLELVLVKGDFDTSNFGVGRKVGFSQVNYLVYVYDLQHKAITHITVTERPEQIRKLLELAGEPLPTAQPSPTIEP